MILYVACGALAITAFLPLMKVSWWWVRIGDFPRVQLLFVYIAVIAGLIPIVRSNASIAWLVVMLASCAVQIVWIYAYLPIARKEVQAARSVTEESRIRLMSANVLQANQEYQSLLDLIAREKPDIVALCEVNQRWIDDLGQLKHDFPHYLVHPLENEYGIALYSRLPFLSSRVRFFVSPEIPSIEASVLLRSGLAVRLFAIHPNPPRVGEDTTKRDAEFVLVGREVHRCPGPAIVMGDLNDVGWSATTHLFQEVSGLLDPRKGRGFFATYNARSWVMRYPLDYLFHSADFRLGELRTLADIGSDHFPLLVELSFGLFRRICG